MRKSLLAMVLFASGGMLPTTVGGAEVHLDKGLYSWSPAPGIVETVLSVDAVGNPASGKIVIDNSIVPYGDASKYVRDYSMEKSSDTQNVGGGTWHYGSEITSGLAKNCWSHYYHPTAQHSATAIIGTSSNHSRAVSGRWAKADSRGGIGEKCEVFWNNE